VRVAPCRNVRFPPIADISRVCNLAEMRRPLVVLALLFLAVPLEAKQPPQSMPLYRSVEDPPGQQPRRVLVNDSILQFGQAGDDRKSLQLSDLGFSLNFLRIDGGVRVQGQPILFPSGSRERIDLEDFSCSVLGSGSSVEVLCRSKADGQLYRSRLVGGGLAGFEIRCVDEVQRICHYDLASGPPIRPTKVQDQ